VIKIKPLVDLEKNREKIKVVMKKSPPKKKKKIENFFKNINFNPQQFKIKTFNINIIKKY